MLSVVVCSKGLPGLWRDVEASHVTLDDAFIAHLVVGFQPQIISSKTEVRK